MKDITIEEAVEQVKERIEALKRHIKNYEESKCETGIYNQLKIEATALKKVLNELEKYKELYISALGHSLNNSIKQNNKHNNDLEALNEGWKIELEKKDKIIDAMAKEWFELDTLFMIRGKNIHSAEELKQYFERKVIDE